MPPGRSVGTPNLSILLVLVPRLSTENLYPVWKPREVVTIVCDSNSGRTRARRHVSVADPGAGRLVRERKGWGKRMATGWRASQEERLAHCGIRKAITGWLSRRVLSGASLPEAVAVVGCAAAGVGAIGRRGGCLQCLLGRF